MNRKLGSVHINEVQGNLFPSDVNFRGDSVSPLLGTAQGLNLGSSYTPRQARRYFARINNLLDRRYASAAPLGSNGFDRNGNFSARRSRPTPRATTHCAARSSLRPALHAAFQSACATRSSDSPSTRLRPCILGAEHGLVPAPLTG